MNLDRKILFIVNPIAGRGHNHISDRYEVVYTSGAGDAALFASEAVRKSYDIVVAVGGDGTVNEVASQLVGSNTALGIIPCGSGNGLANHLGISHNLSKALETIFNGREHLIDTAVVNGHPFCCTTGMGFDADVAMAYKLSGKRMLHTYIEKALHQWMIHKPSKYHIEADGQHYDIEALLITCGNANQWGNYCYITPHASLEDGMIDITAINPINIFQAIPLVGRLFLKSIDKSNKVFSLKAKSLKIKRTGCLENIPAHYDGEAFSSEPSFDIEVKPSSLKVIISK